LFELPASTVNKVFHGWQHLIHAGMLGNITWP